MAGLGDLIVVVEDLATYQAALDQGKTAPSVMYLILAERLVYFNSELWSKAPEEGGGGDIATVEDLINDEYVAAATFTDHITQIDGIRQSLKESYVSITYFNEKLDELIGIITENEEITASALNDLNERLK